MSLKVPIGLAPMSVTEFIIKNYDYYFNYFSSMQFILFTSAFITMLFLCS